MCIVYYYIIIYMFIVYTVFTVTTAIDSPMVRVTSTGSGQPGSRYVLNCSISLPTGVTVSDISSVQWRKPSGGSVTDNNNISGGGSVYISQLILDPLTLSDGGDYTCTATYSLGGQTMATHSISVMSKCAIIDKIINDYKDLCNHYNY